MHNSGGPADSKGQTSSAKRRSHAGAHARIAVAPPGYQRGGDTQGAGGSSRQLTNTNARHSCDNATKRPNIETGMIRRHRTPHPKQTQTRPVERGANARETTPLSNNVTETAKNKQAARPRVPAPPPESTGSAEEARRGARGRTVVDVALQIGIGRGGEPEREARRHVGYLSAPRKSAAE